MKFVCTTFSVNITLDRSCRLDNPVAVEAEVQALIFENSSDNNIIIYNDGSVIRHVRSARAFTASVEGRTVYEDCGAFAYAKYASAGNYTTSSMTMKSLR
jgi:hypothetical protein